MSKLYTEEQVRRLLDMQKGNCYVAILTQTRDEKIANLAISAPLPGGDQFNEHFGGFELPTIEEIELKSVEYSTNTETKEFYKDCCWDFQNGAKWMRDKIKGGNNE